MWILMLSGDRVEVAGLGLWKLGMFGTKMQRNLKALKKFQACPKPGMWTEKMMMVAPQSDLCD